MYPAIDPFTAKIGELIDIQLTYAKTLNEDGSVLYEIPFIDRMGFVFIICVIGMVIISLIDKQKGVVAKGLEIDKSMFRMSSGFAAGALLVCGILVALYTIYW